MTINPFLIFLSLTYWLWAWGPVGGLVAVPSLLILYSIVTHILPIRQVTTRRARRKVDAEASGDVAVALKETTPARAEEEKPAAKAATKRRPATPKVTAKPA